MIKANELRIGNWIFDSSSKELSKIENALEIYHLHDCFEPIPLTPEILEKCGFKKDDYLNGWTIDEFIFYIDEEMNLCLYDDNPSGERVIRSNIHLHELQNIYFALTGKELQGNLTENHNQIAN